MSEVVRLTFVSHAMTDAMAAGRFPTDEPVNEAGRRQLDGADFGTAQYAVCGPEIRARQTAESVGLRPRVEPALADLNCGRWRGEALGTVPPAELAVWLTDPARAPHGGESVLDVIDRIGSWLDAVSSTRGRIVAVTHPAVIRAAILVVLDAPPKSFWRIDIAPISRTVMHFRGHAWTLRSNR